MTSTTGLSKFPFAGVFVSGFAWAANAQWHGAAGLNDQKRER
jgi:hypothetical protein